MTFARTSPPMQSSSSPAEQKAKYIEPAALAELVRDQRRSGRMSDALGLALAAIAGGVWDRYHFTDSKEDFVQDVVLHLIGRPLAKADVQKHLFNYFTTCAIRYGGKLRDKQYGDRRRFTTYAEECVEAGREMPDRRDYYTPAREE